MRKQLKAQDQIMLTLRRIFDWASEQWLLLVILIGVILAGSVAVSIGIHFKRKEEAAAQVHFGLAEAHFQQMQLGGDAEKKQAKDKLVEELKILSEKFTDTKADQFASLFRSRLAIAENKSDEAIKRLEHYAEGLSRSERDLAFYPMAVVYEDAKNFDKALEWYRKISKNEKALFRAEAMLGEARVLRALNQGPEAQKVYTLFLERYPESSEVSVVRGLLAELNSSKAN